VQFNYAKQVYGGTEYMAREFLNRIFPSLPKFEEYQCIIMPGMMQPINNLIADNRQIILWLHNTPTQFHPSAQKDYFQNPLFWEKIKFVIVPSQIAKNFVLRDLPDVNPELIKVIPNAIIPAKYNPDKFKNVSKVKLIHTSGPDRALPILMNSLKYVESDFRLDIYNDFNPDIYPNTPIDKRVMFYGKTPRAAVQEAFEQAHIFVYPSIFEETFCLSLAEGMSAGCLPVYSNFGAVPEISGGRGFMYKAPVDHEEHSRFFANLLDNAIYFILAEKWDPTEQIEYINNEYSWDSIAQYWAELHEKL
jgi:glycosyltransferase involved in cell wall biosynthesis